MAFTKPENLSRFFRRNRESLTITIMAAPDLSFSPFCGQLIEESRRSFIDSFQTDEEREIAEIVFAEQIDIHGGVTSEDFARLGQEVRKSLADTVRPEITLNPDFVNDPEVRPAIKWLFAKAVDDMNSDLAQKLK